MKNFFLICIIPLLLLSNSASVSSQGLNEAPSNLQKYVIHYVTEGDNLHILAAYYLNSPRLWKHIYDMNKNVINNPSSLTVGSKLTIAVPLDIPPQYETIEEYKKTIGVTIMKKKTDKPKRSKSVPRKAPQMTECTDSDDGISENTIGATCAQGEVSCETDFCRPDHILLVEYFCENNAVQWKEISCPDGCVEGRCLPKAEALALSQAVHISSSTTEISKETTPLVNKEADDKEKIADKKARKDLEKMIDMFDKGSEKKSGKKEASSFLDMADNLEELFAKYGMILLVLLLVIILICFASMWGIFSKAGIPGWKLFIPFYNLYLMMNISGLSGWLFFVLMIPFIGTVMNFIWAISLAKRFQKGAGFAFGIFFLPFIFLPILAFGKAEYS